MSGTRPQPDFQDAVKGCSRCGADHEALYHRAFLRPFAPPEAGGIAWEWWASCPATGDPILVAPRHPGTKVEFTEGSDG